jgi:hypothetical protein
MPATPAGREGDVRARAGRLAGSYSALATRAALEAVRWRWATPSSGYGFAEPLRLERMGCSPGDWLEGPPPLGLEHEAIGFDASDRVAWVRQHDATGEIWLERFARWSAGEVEVACFSALPARLQCVTLVRLAGGVPVESERYLPPTGSGCRERYEYERGRLARVVEEGGTVVKEIVYGADGRVAGVDALEGGLRRAVWRAAVDVRRPRHSGR